MRKIILEVQHFEGCPNAPKMLNNVKTAITGFEDIVEYRELIVDNIELAANIGFRGSPTLIIDGIDFEGMAENKSASLNCRLYKKGVPTPDDIIRRIEELIKI